MKTMASVDYHRTADQAEETLQERGEEMSRDERAGLELWQKREKTLRTIERLTGLKFNVFKDADLHMAAFITVADLNTNIAEASLDDGVWAAYAAWHEKMHHDTEAFMRHGDYAYLPGDHYDALKTTMAANDVQLGNVDLTEGFTDMLTAQEHGTHANSGYNDHKVPAAEKLEKICLAMTGESLARAFRKNDRGLFHRRLERLAKVLLMREKYEQVIQNGQSGEWGVSSEDMAALKPRVYVKMKAEKAVVDNPKSAEEMVKDFLEEARMENAAYEFLGVAAANDL